MPIEALDHINVAAADLDRSERFYRDLLDLESRPAPPPMTHATARWLYDREGRAILHLNSVDFDRHFDRDMTSGPTGALHHVALRCTGHEETLARVERMGLDYRLNEVTAIGLRQIFVHDMDGVLLELNFFGE